MSKIIKKIRIKKAFTLAEVLITLGIIGVVAALTIPNLVNDYKEKQTIAQLKKVYTQLSQVYLLAMEDNGGPLISEFSNDPDAGLEGEIIVNKFANALGKYYIKIIECNSKNKNYCYTSAHYKTLWGNKYTYGYGLGAGKGSRSFILPDGTIIGFGYDWAWQIKTILIDLNGKAKPNRYGYDAFAFLIDNDRIIPYSSGYCSMSTDNPLSANNPNGMGCTWWVIANENLNYQKCIRGIKSFCKQQYYIGNNKDICDPTKSDYCVNK